MNDARWLDADEQRTWRTFLRMHRRLAAQLHRQLQKDSSLSLADYEVLVSLTDAPEGQLRPVALQRALQWEQSRLSHQVTRMQRRGLVERKISAEDGRGALVRLTRAGRSALDAAAPGHVETVRSLFFDQLTTEQVHSIAHLCDRVLQGLDAADEKH